MKIKTITKAILIIGLASAVQIQAMNKKKSIAKKKGKEYLKSLIDRGHYNRNGISKAPTNRQVKLLENEGHQKLAYVISKRTNSRLLERGKVTPRKKLEPIFDNEQVTCEQTRENGLIFLQDFMKTNQELNRLQTQRNYFLLNAPYVIHKLRQTGNCDFIPYIKEEQNNIINPYIKEEQNN